MRHYKQAAPAAPGAAAAIKVKMMAERKRVSGIDQSAKCLCAF